LRSNKERSIGNVCTLHSPLCTLCFILYPVLSPSFHLSDKKSRKGHVYKDKNGQVYVSQLNVGLMGMMFGGTIADVMGMAGKDLNEVVASVAAK
jgi:hypothetical protein